MHFIFDSPVTSSQVSKVASTLSDEIVVNAPLNEDNVDISGSNVIIISFSSAVVHRTSSPDEISILVAV